MMAHRLAAFAAIGALLCGSVVPAVAQTAPPQTTGAAAAEADTGETIEMSLLTAVPDPGTIAMPVLEFAATPVIEADFDKYFYFHRAATSFPEALADLRECDAFARGLTSGIGYQPVGYPYAGTMAGAVGGAIGNLMVAMIFGSAEKRKARRANMRRCMHYKGYARFGLEKELWQKFNFEEGLSGVQEADRQRMLAQQAKVASSTDVKQRDLGL